MTWQKSGLQVVHLDDDAISVFFLAQIKIRFLLTYLEKIRVFVFVDYFFPSTRHDNDDVGFFLSFYYRSFIMQHLI